MRGVLWSWGVKVKVTCWDWDRELLTRRTLGLGCTVALGCTVGPPEVYRGPCMKITPWNSYITYTYTTHTHQSPLIEPSMCGVEIPHFCQITSRTCYKMTTIKYHMPYSNSWIIGCGEPNFAIGLFLRAQLQVSK